jgi:DNA polymerase-4
MEASLGKFGSFLHRLSNGEDDREVESEWEPKSSGTETTFEKDVLDTHFLTETLIDQAEDVVRHLKKIDRRAKTVTLKLRYSDFKTITRSRTLWHFTDDVGLIFETAEALLTHSTEAGRRPVRLIGISASHLVCPDEPEQLWLDLRFANRLGNPCLPS